MIYLCFSYDFQLLGLKKFYLQQQQQPGPLYYLKAIAALKRSTRQRSHTAIYPLGTVQPMFLYQPNSKDMCACVRVVLLVCVCAIPLSDAMTFTIAQRH